MVSRFRASFFTLIGLCCLAVSLRARAESAAVLPHAGDTRLEAARVAAHRAVIESLREQGLTVRALTARPTKNPAELQSECALITCAPGVLTAHQIEIAAAIAVWQAEEGAQVNVTLVDALGRKYPGYAIIVSDDAAAAARAALLEARSLQLLGPGPWIHVRGAPAGAAVLLDGKPVGLLPYRGAISPGDHELEVKADGYAAKRMPIVITLEPTTTARVQLELEPERPTTHARTDQPPPHATDYVAEDPARAPVDEASPWNFILGGVLAAGGVALATIEPIPDAIEDGDCAEWAVVQSGPGPTDRQCKENYDFGGESVLKISIGALLAAAGVTVMIWQPLRMTTHVDAESAMLGAELKF